jgi:microcystin-dependent protein
MKKMSGILMVMLFSYVLANVLWISISDAAVPHLINYQGKLTDSGGNPLNGTYSITFRIYDAETAGNLLWEETQANLMINKGVFNVLLGSVNNTLAGLSADKVCYLEIKVGNEVMSPRQRMGSSLYAINGVPKGVIVMWSGRILDIPPGWALCDGTNGTPDLRDKFIVGARQDDGGFSKTKVTGALTTVGGEAAHKLTIEEMPAHVHSIGCAQAGGTISAGDAWNTSGGASNTSSSGGSVPHNNLPPYYSLAFIMKL